MIKKLINYWEVLIIFFLSLTPLLWLKDNQIIIGHDSGFRLDIWEYFKNLFYSWSPLTNFQSRLKFITSRTTGSDASGLMTPLISEHPTIVNTIKINNIEVWNMGYTNGFESVNSFIIRLRIFIKLPFIKTTEDLTFRKYPAMKYYFTDIIKLL